MTTTYRVGVDIGGTFTDIVLLGSDGTIHTKKVSSSVENYAQAIVDGLSEVFRETGLGGGSIEEIRHGTTVASNAILEQKGARVGLITTKGFRDVLEIRTLRMPKLYDLTWTKPAPLVERYLRKVVDERIDHLGQIDRPSQPRQRQPRHDPEDHHDDQQLGKREAAATADFRFEIGDFGTGAARSPQSET